jgi:hypothetical protein
MGSCVRSLRGPPHNEDATPSIVDLASGRERLESNRSEYWYDDERDVLHVRLSAGGRLLPGGEFLHTPEGFYTDLGLQDQARPPRLASRTLLLPS